MHVLPWVEEILYHFLTKLWDQIFTTCFHNLYIQRLPGHYPRFLPGVYLYLPRDLQFFEGNNLPETHYSIAWKKNVIFGDVLGAFWVTSGEFRGRFGGVLGAFWGNLGGFRGAFFLGTFFLDTFFFYTI